MRNAEGCGRKAATSPSGNSGRGDWFRQFLRSGFTLKEWRPRSTTVGTLHHQPTPRKRQLWRCTYSEPRALRIVARSNRNHRKAAKRNRHTPHKFPNRFVLSTVYAKFYYAFPDHSAGNDQLGACATRPAEAQADLLRPPQPHGFQYNPVNCCFFGQT